MLRVVDFEDGRGRGVVAGERFARGTLVETSHCLLFTDADVAHANSTILREYTFTTSSGLLLALNHGSLFNHSPTPNLDYRVDEKSRVIRFFAARDIEMGEELLIFYGHNLWFTPTGEAESTEAASSSVQSSSSSTSDSIFGDIFS